MINQFTKYDFETYLNSLEFVQNYEYVTTPNSEIIYFLTLKEIDYARIAIASSINSSTLIADKAGQNSIRAWLIGSDNKPFGSKINNYTTRVIGWQERLTKIVGTLYRYVSQSVICNKCLTYSKIFVTKKNKRVFTACNCKNGGIFIWLDEEEMNQLSLEFVQQQPSVPNDENPYCPKCSSLLTKRNGRYGEFYGCSSYPSCKFTCDVNDIENYIGQLEQYEQPEVQISFTPEQNKIFNWVKLNAGMGKNLIINAYAGSGKTFTIINSATYIPTNMRVVFIAFNKHNREDLKSKVPSGVETQTYHSFGYKLTRAMYKSVEIDQDYVKTVLLRKYDFEDSTVRSVHRTATKIIGILKNMLHVIDEVPSNIETIINDVMGTYDISHDYSMDEAYPGEFQDLLLDMIHYYFEVRFSTLYNDSSIFIDFDDMCWIPAIDVTLQVPIAERYAKMMYDVIYIDEAQDTNPCQIQMLRAVMQRRTSLIAVGDRHQAIYAFRGADAKAIDNIKAAFQADELALSMTFRCSTAVVELVRAKFPYIDIKAAPIVADGSISHYPYDYCMAEMEDGDMVLCRTNAPLVSPVLELLRSGKKATIRGKDIGKNLILFMKKFKAYDVSYLIEKMMEYRAIEIPKLIESDKEQAAIALSDKIESIIALSDGLSTVDQVATRIESLFSEDSEGVLFSTVHKAKGLEANRVYILKPSLMPHPAAVRSNNGQEKNIEYVALTRSKDVLCYMGE